MFVVLLASWKHSSSTFAMNNLSAIIVAEQYLPDFITCYAGLDGTVRNAHVLAEYLVGSCFLTDPVFILEKCQ